MAQPERHVLVILDKGAVPFCTYENPHFFAAPPAWIGAELLAAFLRHARKTRTTPTFLLGRTRPPAKLDALIAPFAKIVPLALAEDYPDAVVVVDETDDFETLSDSVERNLILRCARPKGLAALVEALAGKFRRLSIHLTQLPYLTARDLAVYEQELAAISKLLARLYRAGDAVEINLLSDRIMLKRMRNCGAGDEHLTLAPNGKLYLCPAFYHDDENSAVGSFDAKKGIEAKVTPRVKLERAPLCSRCDAFHCKRCIYLSRQTTGELNVPSEQQCAAAHLEREASRRLLIELDRLDPFVRMPRIPELNYRDPLECIDLPSRGDPASDPML